jgi:HB1, ASXL, restriction endonuclease HTH domain
MPRTTKQAAKLTGREALIQVLRAAGTPLKARALCVEAAKLAKGLRGRTPEATLSAQLYVEAAKLDGVFVKAGKGEFDLRERQAVPARRRRRAKEGS